MRYLAFFYQHFPLWAFEFHQKWFYILLSHQVFKEVFNLQGHNTFHMPQLGDTFDSYDDGYGVDVQWEAGEMLPVDRYSSPFYRLATLRAPWLITFVLKQYNIYI